MWKERLPANSHTESETALSLDEAQGRAGTAKEMPAVPCKGVLLFSHLIGT